MWENVLVGGDSAGFFKILVSAPLLYIAVVGFIRLSGKRSTSQMNNFDWIVTVALGSLVGSGVISKDIGVLEVALAIAVLLSLQYVLTWSVIRYQSFENLVKATPRLLVHKGRILTEALRDERISDTELMAALRERGQVSLDDVRAVVLENDGTFSVIAGSDISEEPGTLRCVPGFH